MKSVSATDVESHFGDYLARVDDEPILITRDGKPIAALVSVADDDELERLRMAHSPHLRRLLDEADARIERGQGIPHEEFWKSVDAMYGDHAEDTDCEGR